MQRLMAIFLRLYTLLTGLPRLPPYSYRRDLLSPFPQWENHASMRIKLFCLTLTLLSLTYAKEPKRYQSGTLLQMDSVDCGFDENGGKSFAGEVLGTDSEHKKTHQLLCQEYVLQNDRVIYRIRPRDEKHPVLLPVGEKAQFRIQKDKMLLLVEDGDNKEREYNVVSITPRAERSETKAADAAPSRLNHLQ
jgi:hypothetical protein